MNKHVINPVTEFRATTELTDSDAITEATRNMIGASVTNEMALGFKIAMLIVPFFFVLASYLLYRFKFKIDKIFIKKLLLKFDKV